MYRKHFPLNPNFTPKRNYGICTPLGQSTVLAHIGLCEPRHSSTHTHTNKQTHIHTHTHTKVSKYDQTVFFRLGSEDYPGSIQMCLYFCWVETVLCTSACMCTHLQRDGRMVAQCKWNGNVWLLLVRFHEYIEFWQTRPGRPARVGQPWTCSHHHRCTGHLQGTEAGRSGQEKETTADMADSLPRFAHPAPYLNDDCISVSSCRMLPELAFFWDGTSFNFTSLNYQLAHISEALQLEKVAQNRNWEDSRIAISQNLRILWSNLWGWGYYWPRDCPPQSLQERSRGGSRRV